MRVETVPRLTGRYTLGLPASYRRAGILYNSLAQGSAMGMARIAEPRQSGVSHAEKPALSPIGRLTVETQRRTPWAAASAHRRRMGLAVLYVAASAVLKPGVLVAYDYAARRHR
eukprot:6199978-Pleurochrysis_carterae.AAC.7